MATFSKSSFSASSYAAARPSYSPPFYTALLAHHHGPRTLLLDLGTGHGTTARALAPSFSRIIATDPSAGMLAQARLATPAAQYGNIEFRQAAAEDLSGVVPADGSVDAVLAAQAAHWFDWSRAWPELARVVRKGGTLALWGYKDCVFVGHARATGVLERYCYARGVGGMGEFWEMPGRGILRGLYGEIEPPGGEWEGVVRRVYEPGPGGGGRGERVMGGRMRLGEVEGYLRTFSAFVNWREANPERRATAEGGRGDVVDECMEEMVGVEPEWRAEGEGWREKEVEVEWGTVMLMARRR